MTVLSTSEVRTSRRREPGRHAPYMAACLLALTAVTGFWLAEPSLHAQDEEAPKVNLWLSSLPDDKAPEKASRPQVLRPNVVQEVFTYVENKEKEDVTVSVQVLSAGVKVMAQNLKVKAETLTSVLWPRIEMSAVKLAELKGPVVIRLVDAKEKQLGPDYMVLVDRPSNYLTASMAYYPGVDGKNRLEAKIEPKEGFKGPPCRVELVLRPDRIPGFVAGQKKRGLYADYVTTQTKRIYLEAENLQFTGPTDRNGLVYLTVDGCERAFTFNTTFARTGTPPSPERIQNPAVVFTAPRYAIPSQPVPVRLEVDDLLPADEDTARILVELVKGPRKQLPAIPDEAANGSILVEYKGQQQKRLLYSAGGPLGGLLFRPEVKDWDTRLDLGSVFGEARLRVRLLNAKNEPIKFLDKLNEKQPEVTELYQTIFLDDTAPENLAWWMLPEKVVRGKAVVLKATADDPESGISEVWFWEGKPTLDGKIPADVTPVPGLLVPGKERFWAMTQVVPLDQGPRLTVSAQFVNGVGLRKNIVTVIPVVDPDKPIPLVVKVKEKEPEKVKPKKKPSIAGTVVEGDRLQPGVSVELFREREATALTSVRTGDTGAYVFKDVEPGSYRVRATKTASLTRGEKPVTIKDEEQKTGLEIKLYR